MDAAHRPSGVVVGHVHPRDAGEQAVFGEFVGAEQVREEPAVVAVRFDVDDRHPADVSGRVLHSNSPFGIGSSSNCVGHAANHVEANSNPSVHRSAVRHLPAYSLGIDCAS